MLFLSFWTNLCLIRAWLCSFNVCVDKDCLEVNNTHFDYSARLFSSRGKSYIHLSLKMKVFRKLRPIFDTHHAHESQISPVAPSWFFHGFFFSSFTLPFFFSRQNCLLTRTPLFSLFPLFFRRGFTWCRVFLLLQCNRKRTINVNCTFRSLTMEIKIMKNGFSLLWAMKQNYFFL